MEERPANRFDLRSTATFVALLSGTVLALSSVVLYFRPEWLRDHGPEGRAWTDLHIAMGLLLVIAACVHLTYNWGTLKSYLSRVGGVRVRRLREFASAGVLVLALTALSLGSLLPIGRLMEHGHHGPPQAAGQGVRSMAPSGDRDGDENEPHEMLERERGERHGEH